MTARAIREKKAVVSNDSKSDANLVFGKKYDEFGIRSMAILPLVVAGEAEGVLALYASEVEFFRDEELKLLKDLAGDISYAIDHIDQQERLDYLAYYDVLTGLANRRLFLERVALHMRNATSTGHELALFLIDLERFKNINDSLGQPAGDTLLKQVAEWLTLRTGDPNLLARVGADHFALVLPVVRKDGNVTRLVEITMDAFLQHPFRLNESVLRIAAKVGVAVFPDDGANADALFSNAEAALKKAKASGDRYLMYSQNMSASVAGKLTLENQLRQALDNEEFVLHYQPKVNLKSGKLTSAEALIRWNDPRTGLIAPARFIPILEETGLINDVGRWALRKAVEDYLRWRAAGLAAVRIAVNVSPLQLRKSRLHRRNRAGNRHRRARGSRPGTGDYRKPHHGRRRAQYRQPACDPRAGRDHSYRRLRHRLLLPQLPCQAAGGYAEDRSIVRTRHDCRTGRSGAGVHHHQPGPFAGAQGGGRRRGNRRAIAFAALARLRRNAGLPVQPASAGRNL
jgi:diguanylate cyclase (GGDEF)-like protein